MQSESSSVGKTATRDWTAIHVQISDLEASKIDGEFKKIAFASEEEGFSAVLCQASHEIESCFRI